MKNQLKFVFLIFLLFFIKFSFAQLTVSFYSFGGLSISTDNNKMISVELKTFLNRSFEDLMFEHTIMYNFEQKEFHQISIGLGLNSQPFGGFDFFNGITIPIQLEISPFEKMKNISFLIECTPQIGEFYSSARALWGIRYKFIKK